MVRTYGHIIAGKEVKSDSKKTFPSINPTTEQPIARFQQGTQKDLNKAITSAQKAQKKWSNTPSPHRGETLLEISKLLKKHKQRLGKLVSIEMGKILQEGLGDVQEAIDIFEGCFGYKPELFRPPYNKISVDNQELVESYGMSVYDTTYILHPYCHCQTSSWMSLLNGIIFCSVKGI